MSNTESIIANAETFRIRALAYLVGKEVSKAQLEIQKALDLEPRWMGIRFAAGVIDYFSALSPVALPDYLVPWPEPVDWGVIKRDDESLNRLREGARLFHELAAESDQETEEKQNFETWHLACLANDPSRQDEAASFCKQCINGDPTHYSIIAWLLARNYETDLEESEKAFERLVDDGSASIPQMLVLVSLYLVSGKSASAESLLSDTKHLFLEHDVIRLWTIWYVKTLITIDNPEAAIELVETYESDSELHHAKTSALRALAEKTNDWQDFLEYMDNSYNETGNAIFLFEALSARAQRQDWSYVSEHAQEVIEALGTADALSLAAIATYNAGRDEQCLRLLDQYSSLFEEGRLPSQLRRIRTLCLQALGILPQAIIDAESLIHEEPTADNLSVLAQLYFSVADFKRLALLSRQIIDHPDISQQQLLMVSQWTLSEDLQLAVRLWRTAVNRDIPDNLVGLAMNLGFQLGLDSELGPLFLRLTELAQQTGSGVQVIGIEELVTIFKQRQQQVAEITKFYNDGTAPIHIIADQLNTPLADFYHRFLEERESKPLGENAAYLLTRHGGRPLAQVHSDSSPEWRLHLDITAILLAEHLGILENVEQTFAQLRIPPELIPALVHEQAEMRPNQPSRLSALQEIIERVSQGSIAVQSFELPEGYENATLIDEMGAAWVALFEAARANGGYLVDYLPLLRIGSDAPPRELPSESINQPIINIRAIVESLRLNGPLSQNEYHRAIESLGGEGQKLPSDAIPNLGSSLFCDSNITEVLAGANLLQTVCEHFQIHIHQQDFDRVNGALQEFQKRFSTADWIGNLVERISTGVQNNTYEIIPTPTSSNGDSDDLNDNDIRLKLLQTLLQFEATNGDVIWIDDRYLNGFPHRIGAKIIDISEVLKALVSANSLSLSNYFEKLLQLRAANVRFLPIEKDEIVHHLKQARVVNRVLVETRELRILRRYAALSLLGGDLLQRPPMPEGSPNPNGEIPFVLGFWRAMENSLVELWRLEADEDAVILARAEWLIENFYLDHLGLFEVTNLPRAQQDDRYVVALSLAGLISASITLPTDLGEEGKSPRRSYLAWLYERLLRRRFETDPLLISAVTDVLKQHLISSQEEIAQGVQEDLVKFYLQKFYDDLPEQLQLELSRDADFNSKIGIVTAVTVFELSFEPNDFWNAASNAINGRHTKVTTLDSDIVVTFSPCEQRTDRQAFCFVPPGSDDLRTVTGDDFELLSESSAVREAALRKHRDWFDCTNEEFERVIAKIASMENPQLRMDEVRRWREASIQRYYTELYRRVVAEKTFQFEQLLPPVADGMLYFYKISSSDSITTVIDSSALTLVQGEGLLAATQRLSGLPMSLPESLKGAIDAIPKEDRRLLIKQLVRSKGSPISRIHLLHLLSRYRPESEAYGRLAVRLVNQFLSSEGESELGVFLAVLRWVNTKFDRWPEVRDWSPENRLALVWGHAHQLYTILVSAGAPLSTLQDTFLAEEQRTLQGVFERDLRYWFDVANPRGVISNSFMLMSLAYGLSEKVRQMLNQPTIDAIRSKAFPEINGPKFPDLSLLKDSTQANNSLGSFLGGDRGEKLSSLLGDDALLVSQASLRALAGSAVDMITEDSRDARGWMSLAAVLGGLPPYEELSDRLVSAMRQSDFVELIEENLGSGWIALQATSSQLINLNDTDLREHMKVQLLAVAKSIHEGGISEYALRDDAPSEKLNLEQLSRGLIQVALDISIAGPQPTGVAGEFVGLLNELVEALPGITPTMKPIVQLLIEGLPIAYSQQFWPLLVRLRAL